MIILVEGIYGAGKTTYIDQLKQDLPDAIVIKGFCKSLEECKYLLDQYEGQTVIFDRLFLLACYRNNKSVDETASLFKQLAKEYTMKSYFFTCNRELAWQRESKKIRSNQDYIDKEEFDKSTDFMLNVFSETNTYWDYAIDTTNINE